MEHAHSDTTDDRAASCRYVPRPALAIHMTPRPSHGARKLLWRQSPTTFIVDVHAPSPKEEGATVATFAKLLEGLTFSTT